MFVMCICNHKNSEVMRVFNKGKSVASYEKNLNNLAANFNIDNIHWFKESKKTKSGSYVFDSPDGDVQMYVKAYRHSWFKRFAKCFIDDKVKRIWGVHCRLYEKGVNVPKPIAMIQKQSNKSSYEYIISEWLEDTHDLRSLVSEKAISIEEQQIVFIHHAANLLASIHKLEIVHGDFKYANLMLSRLNGKLFSVDFDGAKQSTAGPLFAKDVARYLVSMAEAGMSAEERSSFLREYAETAGVEVKLMDASIEHYFNKITDRHKIKYPGRY